MRKKEIISTEIARRLDQIMLYEINVENYKRAIQKAELDSDLSAFCKHLKELLISEGIELKKEQTIVSAMREQLADLEK